MSLVHPALLFLCLPIFLIVFAAAGRLWGSRGALTVLTAASLLFGATQGIAFLVVIVASALVNYALLMVIVRSDRPGSVRLALFTGIAANIGLLTLAKYTVWLGWIPVIGTASLSLAALIPTTLSFLTFQRSVALLDGFSARGAVATDLQKPRGGEALSPADPPLRFVAFASMFPNLLIGPIAYLVEIVPQFARSSFGRIRSIDLSIGLTLLAIGLVKKFYFADIIGRDWVDPVFADVAAHGATGGLRAFEAMVAYYVQLYFDFSGYSDMALGVARMIGITLPINFDSPSRATGIVDFYRRWHITLTRVIARFLFSPLSIAGTRYAARKRWRGARAQAISLWLPLIVNFIVIGLWHGPRLTYVLFGTIHGLWYILETEVRGTKWWKKRRKTIAEPVRMLSGMALTIPLLILTFALFRSATLVDFGNLLGSLGNPAEPGIELPTTWKFAQLGLAYAIVMFGPNAYEMLGRYRPGIRSYINASITPRIFAFRWRPTLFWGLLVCAAIAAVISKMSAVTPFAYQVF